MIFGKLRIMTFRSGAKQGKAIPIAVTNPIDIDLKADEFRAKGDLLAESTPLRLANNCLGGCPNHWPVQLRHAFGRASRSSSGYLAKRLEKLITIY